MKHADKINFIKENNLSRWVATREGVFKELSENQSMFCCCGRITSLFHERICAKFNRKVDLMTIGRLKNL